MIAINGTPIQQIDKENVFKKIYDESVKLLKENKEYVLKFVPALMTRKDPTDPNGRDEYPTGISFMATQRYVCEHGECEFTYYSGSVQRKHGIEYTPRRLDFNKVITLYANKDIDLAFFMIMVATVCQKDPRFEKYQNARRNPNAQYFVEDLVADSKNKLHYEQMVTKVRNAFFDPDRMLPDSTIAELCADYRIDVIEGRSPEELRTLLAGTVMKMGADLQYNLPSLERFYDKIKNEPPAITIDEEIVTAAIAAKAILKETIEDQLHWTLIRSDGQKTVLTPIVKMGKGKHEAQLNVFLSTRPDLYSLVVETVEELSK